LYIYFGRGNRKLDRKILTWSLPVGLTCIGAGRCAEFCYARKAERHPVVRASRIKNYKTSLSPEFPKLAIQTIKRSKCKFVRVHVSGDFYNQEYVDKWAEVASALPDVTFLAYTKAHILDFSKLPDNFILFRSVGGKWDHLIRANDNIAIVISEKDVPLFIRDWFICSVKHNHCLQNCNYCFMRGERKRVAFIKH